MKTLQKPPKLERGDTIAAISPCNGWAGDAAVRWKYDLGVARLREMGLHVLAAPNALKGSAYLSKNPVARAEDVMWAFEHPSVRAVIANVGGNDSIEVIPHIRASSIIDNPKIFIGYSDAMNLHLLCYHCGLSSFYGPNLLYPVAEAQGFHPYTKHYFERALFETSAPGRIEPAREWSCAPVDHQDPRAARAYLPCGGYELIQGRGIVEGRLFGGHTGLMELENTPLALTADDFLDAILFLEDIPEFYTPEGIAAFFAWLHKIGALSGLRGVILGRANEDTAFKAHKKAVRETFLHFERTELPVLYGLHFGHASPMCVLPYGAKAGIDCERRSFSIMESGVGEHT